MWLELKKHRSSTALFLVYWVAAYAIDASHWHKPPGRDDMVPGVIVAHFLLPVVAGALIACWRTPKYWKRAILTGALVLLIDGWAIIGPEAYADPYGEGPWYIAFPIFTAAVCLAGALLGLLGAASGAGITSLRNWFARFVAPARP